MSDENNKVLTDPQKMQMDIEQLKLKYSKLDKDVKLLETCKIAQGSDLKQVHGEFEQTNKSIEEILQKLNNLSERYCEKGTERNDKNNVTHSMKNCLTNSLKNIAVGTLSVFYAVADKTVEKTSCIKEGFQDIAAEAQYENKKRRCQSVENN